MQPHHVGYLVKDIEKAAMEFAKLGYVVVSDVTYDSYRDINVCFLKNHDLCIELVAPVSESSVVFSLSKKLGATPYHICYSVKDMEKEARTLRERGYVPMGQAMPAPALGNALAAFYFCQGVGIIELICPN